MSVKADDNQLTVCFFASLREAIGLDTLQMSNDYAHVAVLFEQLASQFPILTSMREQQQLLVAVNQQIVRWQHPLQAGDEVAFFPPVTGG